MPDEKRIKDFEPATELLIDDWFAVDSPSQGTRKMQASMFQEGLQTQITTNTENIALHSGQISVLQQGVGNIGDKVDVLDAAITVEAYSASKLYAVGEDCVYEGVRYKCITAIETPEAFDPNKWQAISIEGELNELNSSLVNREKHIGGLVYAYWNAILVTIDFGGAIPIEAANNANTIIATLPSDVPKPSTTKYGVISCGGNSNKFVLGAIQTNGNILIYNYSGASTSYLYGSIKFLR